MGWKNWPYWLIGGIIGLIVVIINFLYQSNPLSRVFIGFPIRFIRLNPDSVLGIVLFLVVPPIFWFIIGAITGAIIGLIVGKIKKKKRNEIPIKEEVKV